MKLSNLIFSAGFAVLALASCNKQVTTPHDNSLKSVEISLENVKFTKAPTDVFLTADDKVVLSSFKIFLTDGTNIVKNIEGTEDQTFYYSSETEALPDKATIHYVPASVNKVVVVGNVAENWGESITTYENLKKAALDIDEQQNYTKLTLFGESGLTPAGTMHDHSNTSYNLYSAQVQVAPLVARFEIDGFAVVFSKDDSKYEKIEVKQIALNSYYETATISPLAASTLVDRVGTANDANAFKFFNENLSVTEDTWFYDALADGEVVLARPAAPDTDGNYIATGNMTSKKAYHFFPGETAPQIFMQIGVYETGATVSTPSYIYSKGFKTTAGEDVTFLPGYVYRMNFQGEATGGDGDLPFNEEDINELDRCLEITVEVTKWNVVTIYPEF